MTGRRSHPRVTVASPWTGVMSVLRDVVIERTGGNEFQAISGSPGIVGEHLSVHLVGAEGSLQLGVRVAESSPVIVNGSLRYRLRLLLDAAGSEQGCDSGTGA